MVGIDEEAFIEQHLLDLFGCIGIDTPSNFNDILEFVILDIKETADEASWHSGDIEIAFRRWIEAQSKS
jgi:hypothetical protein